MKPPICEVCNVRFRPNDGALVACVGGNPPETQKDDRAVKTPTGHPKNKGWFCSEHFAEAEKLSVLLTLPEVIASLRGEALRVMPDPVPTTAPVEPADDLLTATPPARLADGERVCDTCGTTFDQGTAGRVSFVRTPQGLAWHQAMIRDEVSGTNPDHGWFCARHITPALWTSDEMTRSEAMIALMPEGRDPFEYDERPPGVAPDAPFPALGGFCPVTNGGLDGAVDRWFDIAPQTPRAVHAVVHGERQLLEAALGVAALRNNGSISSASTDPSDTRWAGPGVWVAAGYSPHHAGDVVVFVTRQTFREGDQRGPLLQQGLRVLIQRREQSIFEMTFTPADPPTVAIDGLVMLERVLVHQSPLLDEETEHSLHGVVEQLVETLSIEPENVLSLAPDLIGVDLGSGKIERGHFGRRSSVVWPDAAASLAETLATIFASLPNVFDELGLGDVPELKKTSDRQWNPMDGSHPPHCPFSDRNTWSGSTDMVDVAITHDATHWSETSLANASVSLLIQASGPGFPLHFSAADPCDGSSLSFSLWRPTSSAVVAVIRSTFGC